MEDKDYIQKLIETEIVSIINIYAGLNNPTDTDKF